MTASRITKVYEQGLQGLKTRGAVPPIFVYVFMARTRKTLPLKTDIMFTRLCIHCGIQIFLTDVVKMVKLTIRPIGCRHRRSNSLPHVDTGTTVSYIFGTLLGSPFLSECQASVANRPPSPQWYQTGVLSASISFLEIGRSQRVPNQGSTVGGDGKHFVFQFSSFQCRR